MISDLNLIQIILNITIHTFILLVFKVKNTSIHFNGYLVPSSG